MGINIEVRCPGTNLDPKSLLGTTVAGRYELRSIAGAGGMGTVFQAWQDDLQRVVALKILDLAMISSSESMLRFEREARSLSLLSHVHIAGFYAYGTLDSGIPFIVMEYLQGAGLNELLALHGRLPVERVLQIAIQIADAMTYAHESGVVHRDLKPENILLLSQPEPDYVKIVDFGLSLLEQTGADSSSNPKLTKTGLLVGTPSYLSPEQCMGHKSDARSDIYSLSCIIYQMLSGQPPFLADNPVGLIHKHMHEKPPELSKLCKEKLPAGLQDLVLKGLAKDPADRYQNMQDLEDDLLKIAEGQEPLICKSRTQKLKDKNPKSIFLATVIAVFTSTLIAVSYFCFGDSGLLFRCHLSLSGDTSLKNAVYWLDCADNLSAGGNDLAAQKLKAEVESALKFDRMAAAAIAKTKLRLAESFLAENNYSLASRFAYDCLLDLYKARKSKKLNSVAVSRLVQAETAFRKLKGRSLKFKESNKPLANESSRAFVLALLAVDSLVFSDIRGTESYTEELMACLKKLNGKKLDAGLQAATSMLLAALDAPMDDKIPYEIRSKETVRCQQMASNLVEAGIPDTMESEDRQSHLARAYVGVGDFPSAEREHQKWLSMMEPKTESYELVQTKLAAVQEKLGKSEPINKLLLQLKRKYSEAESLRRIACGQIWAGQYASGDKTLDLALSKIDKNSQAALMEEADILDTYAWSRQDAGDYKAAEPYLRKRVAILAREDRVSPAYVSAANELAKYLTEMGKHDEAEKITGTFEIGSGYLDQMGRKMATSGSQ